MSNLKSEAIFGNGWKWENTENAKMFRHSISMNIYSIIVRHFLEWTAERLRGLYFDKYNLYWTVFFSLEICFFRKKLNPISNCKFSMEFGARAQHWKYHRLESGTVIVDLCTKFRWTLKVDALWRKFPRRLS